jgi:hypothetical protein
MKIYACMLITCLLGGLLLTETGFASICDEKETVVFFGNGVTTLEDDAYDSQNIIKDQLKKYLSPEEFDLLGFDVAPIHYLWTYLSQVLKSCQETSGESGIFFGDWLLCRTGLLKNSSSCQMCSIIAP